MADDTPTTPETTEKPDPINHRKVRHVPKGKKYDDAETLQRKMITFKLTQAERAQAGEAAAQCSVQLEEMEKEFKAIKDQWKMKIDRVSALMYKHLGAIASGQAEREVEVQSYRNFDENTVEYWHKGKMVESREMKPEDRQESLKVADGPAKPNVTSIRGLRRSKEMPVDHTMSRTERDEMADGKPVFGTGASVKDAANDAADQIRDVHREETSRRRKKSSVDPVDAPPPA